MDDYNHLNQMAYDQIAARFAKRNDQMLPETLAGAQRLLGRLAKDFPPGARLLDLGCGAGRDMAWFEGQGAQVSGADLSRGMLNEARTRVQGPLAQMDMRFLGFADGCIGAIWCQAALLHLPKSLAPGALAEMARVLMAGGMLYIAVQRGNSEGIESKVYEPVERYYAHYTREELSRLVEQAGFEVTAQGEYESRRPWVWIEAKKLLAGF